MFTSIHICNYLTMGTNFLKFLIFFQRWEKWTQLYLFQNLICSFSSHTLLEPMWLFTTEECRISSTPGNDGWVLVVLQALGKERQEISGASWLARPVCSECCWSTMPVRKTESYQGSDINFWPPHIHAHTCMYR